MDLNDLEKLSKVYGVHPAALLLAPEDGPKFDAMRKAPNIAEQMGPDAAKEWLSLGERLVPKPPGEPAND